MILTLIWFQRNLKRSMVWLAIFMSGPEMRSEQVAEGLIQLSLEISQGQGQHSLFGQPVPVPGSPHAKEVSLHIWSSFKLTFIFPPYTTVKSLLCVTHPDLLVGFWSHIFSQLNKPTCVKLLSQIKCSSPQRILWPSAEVTQEWFFCFIGGPKSRCRTTRAKKRGEKLQLLSSVIAGCSSFSSTGFDVYLYWIS